MSAPANAGAAAEGNTGNTNNTGNQALQNADIGANGSSTMLMIVVMTWQAILINKYSVNFPASIFTGQHVKMNESCTNLWWVTDWSLKLSIFMVIADGALTACLIATRGQADNFIGIFKTVEAVTGFVKVYIGVLGVFVILQCRPRDIDSCPDLYVCAWWCFIGFLLISAVFGCIMCCFLAGVAHGRAAAREEQLTMTAIAASQGQQQNSQYGAAGDGGRASLIDNQALTPFSGQGHKLGAGAVSSASSSIPQAAVGHRLGDDSGGATSSATADAAAGSAPADQPQAGA